jgi:hypothetical protein
VTTYTLPTFSSESEALEQALAASRPDARLTHIVPTTHWGVVAFTVIGELVEFFAEAAAPSGERYSVIGNLSLDGDLEQSEVCDFLQGDDDDSEQDDDAYELMEQTQEAVTEPLLKDVTAAWLALPEQTRLALIADGARNWATYLAAHHWADGQRPGKRSKQDLLAWESQTENLRVAHCRAVAHTFEGGDGLAARRLWDGGWHGTADELAAAAQAVTGKT